MNSPVLAKLPLSFWLLFSILVAYATYNPWYTIGDLLQLNVFWGVKLLFAGIYCGIILLYVTEGSKSLSSIGMLVLFVVLVAIIATLVNAQLLSWGSARYWAQIPLGLTLFFALRWGAMYRAITGRVPVGTAQDNSTHEVHHS